MLEDGFQFDRLKCVIDGFTDKDGQSVEGVLGMKVIIEMPLFKCFVILNILLNLCITFKQAIL